MKEIVLNKWKLIASFDYENSTFCVIQRNVEIGTNLIKEKRVVLLEYLLEIIQNPEDKLI